MSLHLNWSCVGSGAVLSPSWLVVNISIRKRFYVRHAPSVVAYRTSLTQFVVS